jgi:SAM-dependent methyltransferase
VTAQAERMPFPHQSFDRVRADRVLQHISDLKQVLAEMWRVLRPGGLLTIVEPDWKMVALHPGSPAGGDDDHTLHAVLAYKQRVSAHALVGRQLSSLLRLSGETPWEDIRVQAEVFTFTSWSVVDAGLLISGMAQELAKAEPTFADEVRAWLKAIETAAEHSEFLASMQLFYASARKGTPKI